MADLQKPNLAPAPELQDGNTKTKRYRVAVCVKGADGADNAKYSAILSHIVDYFKFPVAQKNFKKQTISRNGKTFTVLRMYRGSRGGRHIKVQVGGETGKGNTRYYQIPMPSGCSIADMADFLSTNAKQNKPHTMISHDGLSYPIPDKI